MCYSPQKLTPNIIFKYFNNNNNDDDDDYDDKLHLFIAWKCTQNLMEEIESIKY